MQQHTSATTQQTKNTEPSTAPTMAPAAVTDEGHWLEAQYLLELYGQLVSERQLPDDTHHTGGEKKKKREQITTQHNQHTNMGGQHGRRECVSMIKFREGLPTRGRGCWHTTLDSTHWFIGLHALEMVQFASAATDRNSTSSTGACTTSTKNSCCIERTQLPHTHERTQTEARTPGTRRQEDERGGSDERRDADESTTQT